MATIEILVKTLDDKRFTVNVKETDKITVLKQKIKEKTNQDVQILMFNGQVLSDEAMVQDYSIQNGSMASVVAKLIGGSQFKFI